MEPVNPDTSTFATPAKAAVASAPDQRRIDLAPAAGTVVMTPERERWLREMLEPGGMSPGKSTRAHARAFRFAEALMRAGYRVTEAPAGPRGGRRFTLDSYDGPRAGTLYRLQGDRDCSRRHTPRSCTCFDDLTDDQLRLVIALRHKANGKGRSVCSANSIARLVLSHTEGTLRTAVRLYTEGVTHWQGGCDLETYARLLEHHDIDHLQKANELLKAARANRNDGPDLEEYLTFLAQRDFRTLRIAVDLFASNRYDRCGTPSLDDLVAAVETAVG